MPITINDTGFPELKEDHLDLAIVSKIAEGKPGNDYHAPDGTFTFLPSGVKTIKGGGIIKALGSSQKKVIADRAVALRANQVGAKLVDGQAVVVILKDGRLLNSFSLAIQTKEGSQDPNQKAQLKITPEVKDQAVEAARDLNLAGDSLHNFLKEKLGESLSPGDLASLERLVIAQRLDDLVAYLHAKMRKLYEGAKDSDTIRIAVGRGYEKKVWTGLEEGDIRHVLDRLQARGWTEAQVQETVTDKLPTKYKEKFNQKYKEDKPDT